MVEKLECARQEKTFWSYHVREAREGFEGQVPLGNSPNKPEVAAAPMVKIHLNLSAHYTSDWKIVTVPN